LPPEFFLMRNIVTAFLSGTNFGSIAGDYASLTRLEELVAEEVWTLRRLDDPSVAEAPAIRRITINACGLEVFPRQLYKATTLEELSISYCHNGEYLMYPFFAIPAGIAQLTRLKVLGLAGIGITNLPPDLLEMTWLETLNLMGNDLSVGDRARLLAALPNTKILLDPA
jgi:Leucine-rich repeat (LRR) protein